MDNIIDICHQGEIDIATDYLDRHQLCFDYSVNHPSWWRTHNVGLIFSWLDASIFESYSGYYNYNISIFNAPYPPLNTIRYLFFGSVNCDLYSVSGGPGRGASLSGKHGSWYSK